MLDIRCFELPPIGTNAYLFLSPEREEAAVFDAPLNSFPTVERVLVQTGYTLTGCYLTHGHWDHTLDGWRFNQMGVPVYAHHGDREFFENPQSMAAFAIPGLEMNPVKIDHWVDISQSLNILGNSVEIRHVPGHSEGSILFWFPDESVAISGDALFQGSIGRTDFPGCSFEVLKNSIQRNIYSLPSNTRILPGHGPETSVSREVESNPFVRD